MSDGGLQRGPDVIKEKEGVVTRQKINMMERESQHHVTGDTLIKGPASYL